MPNVIKYSTGATPTGCLRKGNMLIGNNTADYGATFFNGINPPSGGYTIYLNKASGGPSIYCPANNTQLIGITNQIAGANYTTAAQCLNYFATQTDKIVVNMNYEGIVTDNLVLNLDAGFLPSYPTTSSIWYDISGNANNGTLTNGPTYSSANSGSIVFDGVDDYVGIPFNSNLVTTTVTVNMWCYATTLNVYRTPFTSEPGGNAGVNGYGFRQRLDNTWWWVIGYEGDGAVASTSLTQNVWVNLTGTYNGTTLTLYKNGSLVSTAAGGGRTVNFTSSSIGGNIRVGSLTSGNDLFSGNVAIVQIYNRALSATEVLQNYNSQKSRFGL